MILIVDNKTRFMKQLCSLLKKRGFNYKIKPYGRINLKDTKKFNAIILTGGVGSPSDANSPDFSREIKIIKKAGKPVFGICLGFEVICHAFGTKVKRMTHLEKGLFKIRIKKKDVIFKNCNKEIRVFEDHQWDVPKTKLIVLASSKDGIEAIKHKTKPIYGVQFHPEIRGNSGHKVLENFLTSLSTL